MTRKTTGALPHARSDQLEPIAQGLLCRFSPWQMLPLLDTQRASAFRLTTLRNLWGTRVPVYGKLSKRTSCQNRSLPLWLYIKLTHTCTQMLSHKSHKQANHFPEGNPSACEKNNNVYKLHALLYRWQMIKEDICKFCFLQWFEGKYPYHPALFLFSVLQNIPLLLQCEKPLQTIQC